MTLHLMHLLFIGVFWAASDNTNLSELPGRFDTTGEVAVALAFNFPSPFLFPFLFPDVSTDGRLAGRSLRLFVGV